MAEQCFLTRRIDAIVDASKQRQTTPVSFLLASCTIALVLMVSSLWVPIDVFSLAGNSQSTNRLSNAASQENGDIEIRGVVFKADGDPSGEGEVYWHNHHILKKTAIQDDGSLNFEFRQVIKIGVR